MGLGGSVQIHETGKFGTTRRKCGAQEERPRIHQQMKRKEVKKIHYSFLVNFKFNLTVFNVKNYFDPPKTSFFFFSSCWNYN